MLKTIRDSCKDNFEKTNLTFPAKVCRECQGCVMAKVYQETGGLHPSTKQLEVLEDRSSAYATSGADAGGGEEPAA